MALMGWPKDHLTELIPSTSPMLKKKKKPELRIAEQQRNIRRCYTCGSIKHLRPQCSLRKPRQSRRIRNMSSNPKMNTER
uniref:CCHC-type domain-containing protein n=1 Tax=Peronospora matthiolae TaxID=2874970 RepID=A0AAV1UG81_9STRA